jgi:hypothetical protein
VNAAFGEEFGALRADSIDHLDVGLEAIGHKHVYIIWATGGRICEDRTEKEPT